MNSCCSSESLDLLLFFMIEGKYPVRSYFGTAGLTRMGFGRYRDLN